MNNENSKTSEPHRFELELADKLNFKDFKKNHGSSQFEYLSDLKKHQIRIQQQQI